MKINLKFCLFEDFFCLHFNTVIIAEYNFYNVKNRTQEVIAEKPVQTWNEAAIGNLIWGNVMVYSCRNSSRNS